MRNLNNYLSVAVMTAYGQMIVLLAYAPLMVGRISQALPEAAQQTDKGGLLSSTKTLLM